MPQAVVHGPVVADRDPERQAPKEANMSYYCSECVVNWWPYQTNQGCCPTCGGGTVRKREPASDDADPLYRSARAEVDKRDAYARFELYYAEREQERRAA
jgi:hypothetical protein